MKKLTIKAMATIVVVLVAVSLTFAPNLYAGDPELPGTINPNPEEGGDNTCWKTITSEDASWVFYCGTCSQVPGRRTFFSGSGRC